MASNSNCKGKRDDINSSNNKRKKLRLSDVQCPICMYILVEPVTMPCNHELCLKCFKDNITETSLSCPMCRQRVSNWARSRVKTNSLVNENRWQEIREAFPRKVQKRLDGAENYSSDEDDEDPCVYVNIPNIAEPGEIRREYEEERRKFEEDERRRNEEEAALSRDLIETIQRIEEQERLEKERLALSDEALAKELDGAFKEANQSLTSPELNDILNRKTDSRSSSGNKQKSTLLDRFLSRGATKIDRTGQPQKQDKDAYPYRCISPWEKEEKKTSPSTVHRPPSTYSDIILTNSGSNSTLSYVYVGSRDSSRNVSARTTPVADDTAIASQLEVSGYSRPGSEASSRDAAETLLMAMSTGEDEDGGKEVQRSSSAISTDSITQELNHFKPIRSCPKTPPRRLPTGQFVEVPVVRSTPRSLSGMASPGTVENETNHQHNSVINSPIMKKRLEELNKERKCQVESLSKATDTGNVFGATVPYLEHSYSSPSRTKALVTKTPANSTVSMRELCRKSAVSTVTSSSALRNSTLDYDDMFSSSRKLQFTDSAVDNSGNMATSMHSDPMPLLPLEPNLDEDDDDSFFNPMPRLHRHDGGDATEVHRAQPEPVCPPNLLTNHGDLRVACPVQNTKEMYTSPPGPFSPKALKPVRKTTVTSFSKRKMKKQSDTQKISKHFHKIDSKSLRASNKCTSDLVGVTDRLKDDTGSPNQPQVDPEIQNTKTELPSKTLKKNDGFISTKESKQLVSPRKRPNGLKCKPNRRKVSEITDKSTDATCTAERIVLSLSNHSVREQSSNEKVTRWLEKHSDSDASDSTQFYNDSNNNTPKKVKQNPETGTSCSMLDKSPTMSPRKSVTLTPSRKSGRHKPKKFSAVEGYDPVVSRDKTMWESPDSRKHDALTHVKDGKIDSDASSVSGACKGKHEVQKKFASQSECESVKSVKDKLIPTKSPRKKSKQVKNSKSSQGKIPGSPNEVKKSKGKKVKSSDAANDALTSATGDDVSFRSKKSPIKSKQVRPRKTQSSVTDSTESECGSVKSDSKPKRQKLIKKANVAETDSEGKYEKKPPMVPKGITKSPRPKMQEHTRKQINARAVLQENESASEVKSPKRPKVARKEQKPNECTTNNKPNQIVKDSEEKMEVLSPVTTPRKNKCRIQNEAEEYTPTDDGKKRKCTHTQESEPSGSIDKTKKIRLTKSCGKGLEKPKVLVDKSKKSSRGRGKRSLATGQQRVDMLINRQNSRKDTDVDSSISAIESQSKADSVSIASADSVQQEEQKERSDFKTDAEYHNYLEEQDRKLAEQLQRKFRMEERLNLTAYRFKGSEGEYPLRKKKSTSTSAEEVSSEPPARQRRSLRK